MQIKCIYRKLLHFKIVKLVTRLTVQNIIFFSQGRRVRDKTDVKEACPQCQSQQRRHGFVLPSADAYSIFDHIRTAHIYSDIRSFRSVKSRTSLIQFYTCTVKYLT